MSPGARDHFIPCLLLSGFSVDGQRGRKAAVFQFGQHGARPSRPVAARDLAYGRGFYDHPELPQVDDVGLKDKEALAATVIRRVRAGVDPQKMADHVASFVAIQAARTRALRDVLTRRIDSFLDRALASFGSPEALGYFAGVVSCAVDDGIDALAALGVPRAYGELAFALLGKEGLKQFMTEQLPELLPDLSRRVRAQVSEGVDVPQVAREAHVKALLKMVSDRQKSQDLSRARWVMMRSPTEPLILGDHCVVTVGPDGSRGWLSKFGSDWSELYLPVTRDLAIVGLSPGAGDAPSLDVKSLNEASASLSNAYFYSSRCSQLEEALAATIGSAEPILNAEDEAEIIASLTRNDIDDA